VISQSSGRQGSGCPGRPSNVSIKVAPPTSGAAALAGGRSWEAARVAPAVATTIASKIWLGQRCDMGAPGIAAAQAGLVASASTLDQRAGGLSSPLWLRRESIVSG
jgi:hypothetical protein